MVTIQSTLKIVYRVIVQTKKGVKMYATEFQTVINEPYIYIPNYEAFKGHEVRIVVLNIDSKSVDTVPNKKDDFFKRITKNPKHITNVEFLSREKANER